MGGVGGLVGGGIHRHPVSVHLLWTERAGWSKARMAAGQGFQVTILRFSPFSFPFSSSVPFFFLSFLPFFPFLVPFSGFGFYVCSWGFVCVFLGTFSF